MKRQGKVYLGILLSFVMVFLVSVSVMAAGDGLQFLDDEEYEQTDGEEVGSDTTDEEENESEPVPVTSIKIDEVPPTLLVKGQTAQLTVTIEPEDAKDKEVIWDSSNDAVVTVEDGTVTAVGDGTATITVTSMDNAEASDSCEVTVSLYNDGFHQDPDSDDWYYYKNGSVDTSKTDVMQGTVNSRSGWWNVVEGKVTREETVAHNSNGWWYINSDGMVDFSYKGFAHNSNGWWYLENGKVGFNTDSVIQDTNQKIDDTAGWWYVVGSKVQKDFTGLADYSNANGWWYISDGKVTFDVETVAENKNGWYYVEDSKVIFNYNGFAQNSNGYWYIEDGKVTFNKNSVIQDTNNKIDDTTGWWYVVGSKVQTSFTGLADYSNANGWWYINDGKVTFEVETVAENKNGWYYVEDSKVIFNYNGFAQNSNGCWYIEDGKVTFNKNSVIQDTNKKIDDTAGWWYVVGSKVQAGFTGLGDYGNANGWWYINDGKVTFDVNTLAENKNGWYYVKDSKVDFNYNGFAENSNGWWYIESGKITFNKNSVIQDTNKKIDDTASWWYVVGSKVQTGFTGLGDYGNANGWWYISSGKVDFTYQGFAKNCNGWWYLEDGKVIFSKNSVIQGTVNGTNAWWYVVGGQVQTSFTGLADYSNENGWWYIKNGQVDFTVTTIATNKNGTWYVKDGKVDFSYSGNITVDGVQYTVKNGQVGVAVSSTMNSKAQSQSSSTKWLIVVDTSACKFGVFSGSKGNWIAQKYWDCSPGKPSTPTKKGTFKIQSKGKSFGSSTYTCWYYSQFYGNYLIHSVLYQPGSMTKYADGRLGQQLSHGCVRLALENAKWVYDNIPKGSTVYIY